MVYANLVETVDALFKAGKQCRGIGIVQNSPWMRMKSDHNSFSVLGIGFRPELVENGSMS
jgi:hypothetical protein